MPLSGSGSSEGGWSAAARGVVAALLLIPLSFASAAAAATVPEAAIGPSFDCSKAATRREKTVCAAPDLSRLDRTLASAYRAALAGVPQGWKHEMRSRQRSWVAFMDGICLPGDSEVEPGKNGYHGCLADAYRARIEALHDALFEIGAYRFVTLERYTARRAESDDTGGEKPASVRKTVRLVQLATPQSSAERRWNRMIRKRLAELTGESGSGGSEEYAVSVDAVAPGFIQATLVGHDEDAGPGAGSVETVPVAWLLSRDRSLSPDDLFRDARSAAAVLARLAKPRLKANFAKLGEAYDLTDDQVKELVRPARYWVLSRSGIRIEPDTGNNISPTMLDAVELRVTIPWTELMPYLRQGGPLDIGALRNAP
jgi:uncharacterized protein